MMITYVFLHGNCRNHYLKTKKMMNHRTVSKQSLIGHSWKNRQPLHSANNEDGMLFRPLHRVYFDKEAAQRAEFKSDCWPGATFIELSLDSPLSRAQIYEDVKIALIGRKTGRMAVTPIELSKCNNRYDLSAVL